MHTDGSELLCARTQVHVYTNERLVYSRVEKRVLIFSCEARISVLRWENRKERFGLTGRERSVSQLGCAYPGTAATNRHYHHNGTCVTVLLLPRKHVDCYANSWNRIIGIHTQIVKSSRTFHKVIKKLQFIVCSRNAANAPINAILPVHTLLF